MVLAILNSASVDPVGEATGATASSPLPPGVPPEIASAGIYVEVGEDGPARYVALEPTVFSGAKSSGGFASYMTAGLYKAKWKAVLPRRDAVVRTRVQQPTLYFRFDQTASSPGTVIASGGFIAATSPNEFVLVQMTRKKDARELIVGEVGAFQMNAGTRAQDTVPVRVEKVAPGIYRVTPTEVLGPGEFCVFHAAGMTALPGGGVTGKLFDFGVDPPGR